MLVHVVLQGIAILCRMFPFGGERANGFHYLSEVVRARRPRRSAALSGRHQVIALALLSFWFGGLRIVLPLVLAWLIVVLGGHRLLLAGILVGHIEEVFYRFWCSSRQLLEQVRIPDPCPERGHDDRVAGARDSVLLLHEPPDVVSEGFVFLLCNLIEILLNPRVRERPLVVVDEFGAEISPGIDRIRWKSREPILYGRRQDDGEVIRHGILVTPRRFDRCRVDPKPCLWVPVSVVGLDAFWAEAGRPFGSAKLRREGPDAVDADPIAFALARG